jgi:stage III sporulation protein AG
MLTLKDTNESVYAKNSQESSNDSSYSKEYEYVLYDGDDGETPVLIKQYFPQIQGVAVVCEGGDNTAVKERIINALSSLFNISTSKISVSKLSK